MTVEKGDCQACMAMAAADNSPNDKVRCAETATVVIIAMIKVMTLEQIVSDLCVDRHAPLLEHLLQSPAFENVRAHMEKK